jgi:hypothetical protein
LLAAWLVVLVCGVQISFSCSSHLGQERADFVDKSRSNKKARTTTRMFLETFWKQESHL